MADVAVTRAPTGRVADQSVPARTAGGRTYVTKWSVPSTLTSGQRNDRATMPFFCMWRGVGSRPASSKVKQTQFAAWHYPTLTSNQASFNLNSFSDHYGVRYVRDDFYPVTEWKLQKLECHIQARNNRGAGPETVTTVTFGTPGKPAVANPELDAETGIVTWKLTPYDADHKTNYERYRTHWQLDIWDGKAQSPEWRLHSEGYTTTNDQFEVTADASNWQVDGPPVVFRLRARSQGIAGDSPWTGYSWRVLGWPSTATITGLSLKSTSRDADIGHVTLDTNTSSNYPADNVQLDALVSTDAATAADAAASGDWEPVGSPDNANCSALAFTVGEVRPERGKRSWLRVRTWRDIEGVFFRNSAPIELSALYQQPRTGDGIAIVSATSEEAGTDLWVLIGWDGDQMDGTELSWSASENAWISTEPPETWEFTDSDGPITVTLDGQQRTFANSKTVVVKGADDGIPLYIKARRFKEGDSRSWDGYSKTVIAVPATPPQSVVLSAPQYIAEGEAARFAWSFGGGSPQTAWLLMAQAGGEKWVAASGEGPVQSCSVPFERIERAGDGAWFSASVSTGGAFVESEGVYVPVTTPPEISIDAHDATAQPATFGASCDRKASLLAVVSAMGTAGDPALSTPAQAEGEAVWSGEVAASWTGSGPYSASVSLPPSLDLRDGSTYMLSVVAVDPSGMPSEPAEDTFGVAWETRPPSPEGLVSVSAEGTEAVISLGSASCVFDIYRLGGRPELIASGVMPGSIVRDPYAPYGDGERAYRIASRTADGCTDWWDAPYTLRHHALRIDWEGGSVELPWNIESSPSWVKPFTGSLSLGGTELGSWGAGSEKSGSLGADVIRVKEQSTIEAVMALGEHSGPVMVRTPLGEAYCANVDVDSMGMSATGGKGVAVSLSAKRVALSPAFMATVEEA